MLSIVNMGTPHNVEHAWKHQTVVVCVSNSYLSTNHLASHYDTVCQNLGFDHPHLSVYLVHCFMVGTLRVCCFRVRVICEPIHRQKKRKEREQLVPCVTTFAFGHFLGIECVWYKYQVL